MTQPPAGYDVVLQGVIEEARNDGDIVAMLLTGSLARGDALPGTDIDIRCIVADGVERPFVRELRRGILLEQGFSELGEARKQIDERPMNVYAYLDGRQLFDRRGVLDELTEHARRRFETFATPAADRANIAFLLGCSRDKIRTALGGADLLRAAFVTGTSSWQIMEGLWAANDKPLPPNSSVRPHLQDLAGPPHIEERYRELFLGDTHARVRTALDLIDWIIEKLS